MSLFKYVKAERIDVLVRRRIRFTPHTEFNDPFELKPNFAALAKPETLAARLGEREAAVVHDYFKSVPPHERSQLLVDRLAPFFAAQRPIWLERLEKLTMAELPERERNLREYVESKLGILSLSRVDRDIIMWAHYAEGHQGLVLEFDDTHEWFSRRDTHPANPNYHRLLDVAYPADRYATTFEELDIEKLLTTKSKHWDYEEEVRIIRPLEEATEVMLHGPTELYLFAIPPACVRGVIFGCRMPPKRLRALKQMIRSDRALDHVRLSVMREHPTRFELEPAEA